MMSIARRLKNIYTAWKGEARKADLDILLLTSPPWGTHNPPTGLAYLSSYLHDKGIRATVFDGNIEFYRRIDPKWHKLWLPQYKNWWGTNDKFSFFLEEFPGHIDWLVEKIVSFRAPILGFSVVDPKERMTIELIRRILRQEPSKKIIMGGPAISTKEQRQIFIRQLGGAIDYFVEGPGEEMLLEIMEQYKRDNWASPAAKENDSPLVVSKPIADLDSIPAPSYREFDFSLYDGGGFFVEWSRGCISSCAYCKGRHLLGPYRMKKADHIVAELRSLMNRYGFDHFVVCDNLLNGNIAELERLCDQLIDTGLAITWEGQGIPYRRMTPQLLEKMKRAGCTKMQWGVESGSDTLLMNVSKGKIFTIADVEEVLGNSHRAGIKNEIFIIVGLPGDNDREFQKTADFLRRNRNHIDVIKSINTLHLVHGTDLYDHAADSFGLVLPDEDSWYYRWSSSDGDNDYAQRLARARSLLQLAEELGLPVLEHNLYEGETLKTDR